jgi:hypothetical protein
MTHYVRHLLPQESLKEGNNHGANPRQCSIRETKIQKRMLLIEFVAPNEWVNMTNLSTPKLGDYVVIVPVEGSTGTFTNCTVSES